MAQVQRPAARVARSEEWRRLGEVLGAAFHDDPVWMWVCPDDRRRREHLGAAFAQVIRSRVRSGWSWTTDGLQGGAVWAAPGHWKSRPMDGVRAIPPMVRAIGRHGLRERLEALGRLERHHPREPHWYLEILAADPAMRGRGIGSALIAPMLERCDTEGLPAYLESSKEENLAFYGRFGFEVREVLEIAPSAPPMWAMWRDPR